MVCENIGSRPAAQKMSGTGGPRGMIRGWHRTMSIAGALAAACLLSGCNTMSGFGRDLTGGALYVQGFMPQELQSEQNHYSVMPSNRGMSGVPPLGAM